MQGPRNSLFRALLVRFMKDPSVRPNWLHTDFWRDKDDNLDKEKSDMVMDLFSDVVRQLPTRKLEKTLRCLLPGGGRGNRLIFINSISMLAPKRFSRKMHTLSYATFVQFALKAWNGTCLMP